MERLSTQSTLSTPHDADLTSADVREIELATETPEARSARLDAEQDAFFGGHPDSEDYCTTGN